MSEIHAKKSEIKYFYLLYYPNNPTLMSTVIDLSDS